MPHTANSGSFEAKDWTGVRNKKIVALSDTGKKDSGGSHIWLCMCDCGNTVEIPAHRLSRVKSCGCANKAKYSYSNNSKENEETDLDGEEWKTISNFKNYEISNFGRIKSHNYLGKGATRLLSPSFDKKGYLRIALRKDGKSHVKKVHRLVAEAFIPNDEKKPEVNHKDGDKKNNNVNNLEWVTTHENSKHAYSSGLKENNKKWATVLGNTVGKENLRKYREARKTPVVATRISDGKEFRYESQADASNGTGVPQGNINKILSGDRKSGKGYVFRYE